MVWHCRRREVRNWLWGSCSGSLGLQVLIILFVDEYIQFFKLFVARILLLQSLGDKSNIIPWSSTVELYFVVCKLVVLQILTVVSLLGWPCLHYLLFLLPPASWHCRCSFWSVVFRPLKALKGSVKKAIIMSVDFNVDDLRSYVTLPEQKLKKCLKNSSLNLT